MTERDMRRGRLDVPMHVEAWMREHPRATPVRLARALGLAHSTAKSYRSRLVRRGLVPPLRRSIDIDDVREHIEDGLLGIEAARRLRMSYAALLGQLHRQDLTVSELQHEQVYSARQLMTMFGVSHTTALVWVERWVADGRLKARRRPHRTSPWRITAGALMACLLASPDIAARVVDPAWRAYLDATGTAALAPIRDHEIRNWNGPRRRHSTAD